MVSVFIITQYPTLDLLFLFLFSSFSRFIFPRARCDINVFIAALCIKRRDEKAKSALGNAQELRQMIKRDKLQELFPFHSLVKEKSRK
jgi:hypothetical protein